MISIGDVFEKWTVIDTYMVAKTKRNVRVAKVRCVCGVEKEVQPHSLINGFSKSCGCFRGYFVTKSQTTHGLSNTKLYDTWYSMLYRCTDQKSSIYKNYGGRGISVCDEWMSLETFVDWAKSNGYEENLQIDRIDNDGNYEPSNCQWVTMEENNASLKKRMLSNNKSGVTGVSYNNRDNRWKAEITINKKIYYLGYFTNIEDAIQARKEAEIEHGIFKNRRKNT